MHVHESLPAWVGHNGVKLYPGAGHLASIATRRRGLPVGGIKLFEATVDCAADSEGGQIMARRLPLPPPPELQGSRRPLALRAVCAGVLTSTRPRVHLFVW